MMRVSPLGIFGANPCLLQAEGALATGIRPAVQCLCGNGQDRLNISFQMIGKFLVEEGGKRLGFGRIGGNRNTCASYPRAAMVKFR